MASDLIVRRERYAEIIDDIKALLPSHWQELALYQDDVPLDPDFEMYRRVDDAGMLAIFAVRDERELVGYAIYFVKPHHHYMGHKWAVSDIYWMDPRYRRLGHGRKMFQGVEDGLRAMGVDVMHTTLKAEHPEPAFVLETLGHARIEFGYSKRLK